MQCKHILSMIGSTFFAFVVTVALSACQTVEPRKVEQPAAQQAKPTSAKICASCHEPGDSLWGTFDQVAYTTQSIQMKIDDAVEIVNFDPKTLTVLNVKPDPDNPTEPLREIKRGKEVRVEYAEKGGRKFATLVSAKPPIRVAPEKMISTAEVEKLVAIGPAQGRYLLIDARPSPRFIEGAIPTAIGIPFVAFEKNIDKLPKDKNTLIIYYCGGVT